MPAALDSSICDRYLTEGARVAVALSGGADSVCLCSLMSRLSEKKGFELYALHLNHCIRGDEADRDEGFCSEFCEKLSVRLITRRTDVPALAREHGRSLEEAAREARYSFFEETMRKEGITAIATAHNADDNAETVLLRIIRGASLDGICGIRSERQLSRGLTVIRPILGVSKRDILAYCEENRLDYVTDSTNSCIDYPRNRIRARVLPEAEAINPSFLAVNARNCEILSRDADFIGCEADILYDEACKGERLSVLPLMGKHRALTSRVVSRFCIECGASPERKHIESICDAIDRGGSYALSVPERKRVLIDGGSLYVSPDVREKRGRGQHARGYRFELGIGENVYSEGGLTVKITLDYTVDGDFLDDFQKYSNDSELIYILSTHKTLNFDTIKGSLFARSRISSDSIDFGTFHKDVRRAMSEKRIPQPLRSVIPVICDDCGIVYVPAVGCRRDAAQNGDDGLTVKVELRLDASDNSEI